MPKPGIVICLSGGVVQAVFAAKPETTVAIIDWDADLEDHDLPGVVVFERNGRKVPAFVVQFKTQPLAAFKGSDAEQAIRATGEEVMLTPENWRLYWLRFGIDTTIIAYFDGHRQWRAFH